MKKKFKKDASEIKPLIPSMGYCYATAMITVEGKKVGYMYRERPEKVNDSGWRFFAGDESEKYNEDPENISIYDVNTIANYDPDIIPFLNSPINTAFGRSKSGKFVQEDFEPRDD